MYPGNRNNTTRTQRKDVVNKNLNSTKPNNASQNISNLNTIKSVIIQDSNVDINQKLRGSRSNDKNIKKKQQVINQVKNNFNWAQHLQIQTSQQQKNNMIINFITNNLNYFHSCLIYVKTEQSAQQIQKLIPNNIPNKFLTINDKFQQVLKNGQFKLVIIQNYVANYYLKDSYLPQKIDFIINRDIGNKSQFQPKFRKSTKLENRKGIILNLITLEKNGKPNKNQFQIIQSFIQNQKVNAKLIEFTQDNNNPYNLQKYFQKIIQNDRKKSISQEKIDLFNWATFFEVQSLQQNKYARFINYININFDKFNRCLVYTKLQSRANNIISKLYQIKKDGILKVSKSLPQFQENIKQLEKQKLKVLIVATQKASSQQLNNIKIPSNVNLIITDNVFGSLEKYQLNITRAQSNNNILSKGVVINLISTAGQKQILKQFSIKNNIKIQKLTQPRYTLNSYFTQVKIQKLQNQEKLQNKYGQEIKKRNNSKIQQIQSKNNIQQKIGKKQQQGKSQQVNPPIKNIVQQTNNNIQVKDKNLMPNNNQQAHQQQNNPIKTTQNSQNAQISPQNNHPQKTQKSQTNTHDNLENITINQNPNLQKHHQQQNKNVQQQINKNIQNQQNLGIKIEQDLRQSHPSKQQQNQESIKKQQQKQRQQLVKSDHTSQQYKMKDNKDQKQQTQVNKRLKEQKQTLINNSINKASTQNNQPYLSNQIQNNLKNQQKVSQNTTCINQAIQDKIQNNSNIPSNQNNPTSHIKQDKQIIESEQGQQNMKIGSISIQDSFTTAIKVQKIEQEQREEQKQQKGEGGVAEKEKKEEKGQGQQQGQQQEQVQEKRQIKNNTQNSKNEYKQANFNNNQKGQQHNDNNYNNNNNNISFVQNNNNNNIHKNIIYNDHNHNHNIPNLDTNIKQHITTIITAKTKQIITNLQSQKQILLTNHNQKAQQLKQTITNNTNQLLSQITTLITTQNTKQNNKIIQTISIQVLSIKQQQNNNSIKIIQQIKTHIKQVCTNINQNNQKIQSNVNKNTKQISQNIDKNGKQIVTKIDNYHTELSTNIKVINQNNIKLLQKVDTNTDKLVKDTNQNHKQILNNNNTNNKNIQDKINQNTKQITSKLDNINKQIITKLDTNNTSLANGIKLLSQNNKNILSNIDTSTNTVINNAKQLHRQILSDSKTNSNSILSKIGQKIDQNNKSIITSVNTNMQQIVISNNNINQLFKKQQQRIKQQTQRCYKQNKQKTDNFNANQTKQIQTLSLKINNRDTNGGYKKLTSEIYLIKNQLEANKKTTNQLSLANIQLAKTKKLLEQSYNKLKIQQNKNKQLTQRLEKAQYFKKTHETANDQLSASYKTTNDQLQKLKKNYTQLDKIKTISQQKLNFKTKQIEDVKQILGQLLLPQSSNKSNKKLQDANINKRFNQIADQPLLTTLQKYIFSQLSCFSKLVNCLILVVNNIPTQQTDNYISTSNQYIQLNNTWNKYQSKDTQKLRSEYLMKSIVKLVGEFDKLKQFNMKTISCCKQLQYKFLTISQKIISSIKNNCQCTIDKIVDNNYREAEINKPIQSICNSVNYFIGQRKKLKIQIQQSKKTNGNQLTIIKRLEDQKKQLGLQINQLKIKINELNIKINELNKIIEQNKKEYQKNIEIQKNKLEKLNKQYKKLQISHKNISEEIEKKKEQITLKQGIIRSNQETIKIKQNQITRQKRNFADQKKKSAEIQQKAKKDIQTFKQKYKQDINKQKQKYNQDIKRQQQKYTKFVSKYNTDTDNLNKQYQQLQIKSIQQLQITSKHYQDQIIKINEKNEQKIKDTIQQQSQVLKAINQAISKSLGQDFGITVDNYKDKLRSMENISKTMLDNKLFLNDSYLYQNMKPENKQFVLKSIRSVVSKKIKYTTCVMEAYKGASFSEWPYRAHDKENILLLMTLQNGFQIGAFSENPISKQTYQRGKGFLMSITGKKIFNIKPKFEGKVARYDQYLYIFGNSQLVVKSIMQFEVLWESIYCFFNKGSDEKIVDFIGQQKQKGKFQRMEIHHIIFE